MKHQLIKLENGLHVILIDTEAFPTLTTLLLIGAGSRYENKENNGIAHFFEHMAFKGTKKYPTSLTISSIIEGMGGVFNAFTSKDHTGYWIKATNENFGQTIDVLSEMILHPLLLHEEIEREKGVIVEEINLYEDTPYRKVGEVFDTLLYDGSPLGYDIAGEKKTVKSFNRQTFTDYMGQLYHPNNAVLVVAGGLDKVKSEKLRVKSYLQIIEEKFGKWGEGSNASFERVIESQTKPEQLIKHKKTEQAHFCLGFRTFSFFDKRRYALSLLTTILGGGMSSRLFTEVRERRGLCYYVSTGRELYHDVGMMVTQAGVANDLDKIKEAIAIILKEHRKIAKGDLKIEELQKAKNLLKGRMLLSMEDSSNVASLFGTKKILENSIITPEDTIKQMEAVSGEEIQSLAEEIFVPERLNFAMISPFENNEIQIADMISR